VCGVRVTGVPAEYTVEKGTFENGKLSGCGCIARVENGNHLVVIAKFVSGVPQGPGK